MDKNKHLHRVRDYIRRGNVEKLKDYLSENGFKLKNCHGLDSKKRTPLHLAVKYKRKKMLAYFLQQNLNCLFQDKKGNVPVMTAINAALKSKKSRLKIYEDFVLPLLDVCKDALYVSNKRGITGTKPLKKLQSKLKATYAEEKHWKAKIAFFESSSSSSESTSSENTEDDELENDSWAEKIAQEAEAEYSQCWGQYEADYDYYVELETNFESYSNWGDRIAYEHRAKQSARREKIYGKRKKEAKHSNESEGSSSSKRPRLNVLSEEALAEYAKRQEKLRLIKKRKDFDEMCRLLFDDNSTLPTITIDDIPRVGAKFTDMLLVGQKDSSADEVKEILKKQQVQWHPDKFIQKCGSRLLPRDREEILNRVKEISQIVNACRKSSGDCN